MYLTLTAVRALIPPCRILVMSHAVHLPETSTGLNHVAFSAYVETKPVHTSFLFLLSGSQAYVGAPTTSPLCSSPRIAHLLGLNVEFALVDNLPFLPRSLHRRLLACASTPHPTADSPCTWAISVQLRQNTFPSLYSGQNFLLNCLRTCKR